MLPPVSSSREDNRRHVTTHHSVSFHTEGSDDGKRTPPAPERKTPSNPSSVLSISAHTQAPSPRSPRSSASHLEQEGSFLQLEKTRHVCSGVSTHQPVSAHSSRGEFAPSPRLSQAAPGHLKKLYSPPPSSSLSGESFTSGSSPFSLFFSTSKDGVVQQEKDYIAHYLSGGSPASLLSPLLLSRRVSIRDTSTESSREQHPANSFLSSIHHATLHTASDPDAGWAVKLDLHMLPDSPDLPSSFFSLHTRTKKGEVSSQGKRSGATPIESLSSTEEGSSSHSTPEKDAAPRHADEGKMPHEKDFLCSSPPIATASASLELRHRQEEEEEGRRMKSSVKPARDQEGIPKGGLCSEVKEERQNGPETTSSQGQAQRDNEKVYSVVFTDPSDKLWNEDIAICLHLMRTKEEEEEQDKKEKLQRDQEQRLSTVLSSEITGSKFSISPASSMLFPTSANSSSSSSLSSSAIDSAASSSPSISAEPSGHEEDTKSNYVEAASILRSPSSSSASRDALNGKRNDEKQTTLSTAFLPSSLTSALLVASGHIPDACILGRTKKELSGRGALREQETGEISTPSSRSSSVCVKPRVYIHMTKTSDPRESAAGVLHTSVGEEVRPSTRGGEGVEQNLKQRQGLVKNEERTKLPGDREHEEKENDVKTFWRVAGGGGEPNPDRDNDLLPLPSIHARPSETSLDDRYDVHLLLPLRFGFPLTETDKRRDVKEGRPPLEVTQFLHKDDEKEEEKKNKSRQNAEEIEKAEKSEKERMFVSFHEGLRGPADAVMKTERKKRRQGTGEVRLGETTDEKSSRSISLEKEGQVEDSPPRASSTRQLFRSLRSSLLIAKSIVSGGCEGRFQNQALAWLPLRPFISDQTDSSSYSREERVGENTPLDPVSAPRREEETNLLGEAVNVPGVASPEEDAVKSFKENRTMQQEKEHRSTSSSGHHRITEKTLVGEETTALERRHHEMQEDFIDAVLPLSLSVHGENLPLDIALCMYSSKLDVHPMTLAYLHLDTPSSSSMGSTNTSDAVPVTRDIPVKTSIGEIPQPRKKEEEKQPHKQSEVSTDRDAVREEPEALWSRLPTMSFWKGMRDVGHWLSSEKADESSSLLKRLQLFLRRPSALQELRSTEENGEQQTSISQTSHQDAAMKEGRKGEEVTNDTRKELLARKISSGGGHINEQGRSSSSRFVTPREQNRHEETSLNGLQAKTTPLVVTVGGAQQRGEREEEEDEGRTSEKDRSHSSDGVEMGRPSSLGDTWLVYVPFAVMLGAAAGYIATLHWQAHIKMKEAREKSLCLGPCCAGE